MKSSLIINSIELFVQAIEIQNCELTDVGGEAILDCLKFNKTLVVFDASHNYKISHKIHKKIQMTLSTEPDNYDALPKITNSELRWSYDPIRVFP